jgi:2-methylcitrate dehydratase PrpD
MFGSMSKSLHAGKAAANGVYAALLARRGWLSSREGIEGRRGYWTTLSSRVDPDAATRELGETWELRRDGLKPYACGVVSHPTIDAVRHLKQLAGVAPEAIEEIHAEVNPYVLELMGKREPTVGLEGKFSIYHCAAIGYIDGTARVRQFSDEAVRRPEVVALRGKVRAETNEELATSAAKVRLIAADGASWEDHVAAATGTPDNPMSDAEVIDKFLDLVADRMTPLRARRVAAVALAAGELNDVKELLAELMAAREIAPEGA